MVTTANLPTCQSGSVYSQLASLEDWLANPPEETEWVDGHLIEKTGMTLTHSKGQGNLYYILATLSRRP